MPFNRLFQIPVCGHCFRNVVRIVFVVIAGLVFAACSSTVVVLVPDPEGKVGEVEVSTEGGETILSQAGESTEATSKTSPPSGAAVLDQDEIKEIFASALENEPIPPKRYILYFHFDSAKLSPDAVNEVPKIYLEVKNRPICEVGVIGHSDRTGDSNYNRTLSLRRADAVAALLVNQGVPRDCLTIRYYGESDPLIPTPDGVPEPRNRRVEVEVR